MGAGHERGRRGEALAAGYLESQGWDVLDRNWRAGHREIDLVVRKERVVAFVEVKTRSGTACGDPLESVTWRKRREIVRVARAWIASRGGSAASGCRFRFDAIAVTLSTEGPAHIRHLADAWRIGDH